VVLLVKIKKDVQAKAVNQEVEFKFNLKTNKGGQVVLILQLWDCQEQVQLRGQQAK